jgi:hypothetical protein
MTPLTNSAGARRLVAALVYITAAACGRAESKKDSAVATDSAKGTPASLAAVAAPQSSMPGALPKPLDQMSGDELFTFTSNLTFGGGQQRERRCRGRLGCRGPRPADSTLMRVDAVEGQDSLSIGTLTANGVIATRALNLGTTVDSMYGTRPGKQFQYFLVVIPQKAGLASWQLVELDTTTGARSHHTVSTGRFTPCGHAFRRGARAAFKTCSQAAAELRNVSSRSLFQGDGEAPIWFGCASGCCTADGPDSRG